MPHGHSDYGVGAPISTVYAIEDMAELAARLGSIVTFDRRGNVTFLDDFSGPLRAKWLLSGTAGYDIDQSAAYAKSGSFSAKLKTAAAIDAYAQITHYSTYPVISRLGFEFSFAWYINLRDIEFDIAFYDGADLYEGFIRWVRTTTQVQYWDVTGWHNLSPVINLRTHSLVFQTVKLVVDYTTKEYVRLLFNHHSYDMAALKQKKVSPMVTAPRIEISIKGTSSAAAGTTVYIDDVILTQNEP